MRSTPLLFALSLLTDEVTALIGYGISMYHPYCAFACGDGINPAPLACSTHGELGHHDHGSMLTTPECRSTDSAYLTTLAWCMRERCEEFQLAAWELERYWSIEASQDPSVAPKWTYSEAVLAAQTPTVDIDVEQEINTTMRVPYDLWNAQRRTLEEFERQETLHAKYGIVLLVVGFGTPIVFTAAGYLPFMTGIIDKIKPYIIYPSAFGTYHVRPLPYYLGNAPTVGHGLYIAMFLILNIILSAVDYRSIPGNTWFASPYEEILAYVSCRTGVLAFALAPLVILFSGRNNFLLWCTNWSHSTYMLLHRWIARIFGIQVIVHSIVELVLYQYRGSLAAEQVKPYWIWGIVGTLAVSIMLVISVLAVRRLQYEMFLIIHIILAIFVIAGSWYHVEYLFERKWGYELWLYAACAVWFFDRVLRVGRILKAGIRRATVTEIGEHFVRVDIEGLRWSTEPGHHAYAYFPTIKPLTPWENHPFSTVPTAILRSQQQGFVSPDSTSNKSQLESEDIEKTGVSVTATRQLQSHRLRSIAGVSFYVRKSAGRTAWLKEHRRLFTLLDGPYRNNPTGDVLKCDRLVLIAGGIGITGILAFTNAHPNVRVCWSVKDYAESLVRDIEPALSGLAEKEVRIGRRFNMDHLITEEVDRAFEEAGKAKIGVVVCGPGSMCDDVRAFVAREGRKEKSNVVFELEIDAFSW